MEKKVSIFSSPEVIDALIKSRLSNFTRKEAKTNNKIGGWTEDEIELRNAVILNYIGKKCCSREETAKHISERWDISMSQARKYIASAITSFTQMYSAEDKEEVRKSYVERLEGIMNDAIKAGKTDAALKAQDMLNKISGLYSEKAQVEIQGNIPITFDFS